MNNHHEHQHQHGRRFMPSQAMPGLACRSRRGETERERRAFELSAILGLEDAQPLSLLHCGDIGRILAVRDPDHHLSGSDIERGLLEMGFVEGACVEVLHQGFPGRNPLAVRINQSMTVALRRREASAVLVGPLLEDSHSETSTDSQPRSPVS